MGVVRWRIPAEMDRVRFSFNLRSLRFEVREFRLKRLSSRDRLSLSCPRNTSYFGDRTLIFRFSSRDRLLEKFAPAVAKMFQPLLLVRV